jgi:hypothetical protein
MVVFEEFQLLDLAGPADVVIAMDLCVISALRRRAPTPCPAVVQLLPNHHEDGTLQVPDPHGAGEPDFAECLRLLGPGMKRPGVRYRGAPRVRLDTYPGDGA